MIEYRLPEKLNQDDYVSPADVVGVTTAFFGGSIDLDPASSIHANELVQAKRFFTPKEDGLTQTWKAEKLYLYPPRDLIPFDQQPDNFSLFRRKKRFPKSAQRVWLEEAYRRYMRQEFKEGIVFLTSAEVALRVTQTLDINLPMCILKDHPRLSKDKPSLPALKSTRCLGFILYFPCSENTYDRITQFQQQYSLLGRCFYQ